jgi:hypothetical protein
MNLPELVSGHGCLGQLASEVNKDFIYIYRVNGGDHFSLNDLDTMDQALFDENWIGIVTEIMKGVPNSDSIQMNNIDVAILDPDVVV